MGIRKENFVMFPVRNGWIVYNTDKEFKTGHTHLRSKASALAAIDFVLFEKIPKRTSFYYLTSLCRLSDSEAYIAKVESLIKVRKHKGKKTQCLK